MPTLTNQTILDRKHGRSSAIALIELARSEADRMRPESVIGFWDLIREECERQLPPRQPPTPVAPPIMPLTDKHAKIFAQDTRINFGKHNGDTVAEIAEQDPQYLFWLAESEDPFKAALRRYVANTNVAAYLNRNVQD